MRDGTDLELARVAQRHEVLLGEPPETPERR